MPPTSKPPVSPAQAEANQNNANFAASRARFQQQDAARAAKAAPKAAPTGSSMQVPGFTPQSSRPRFTAEPGTAPQTNVPTPAMAQAGYRAPTGEDPHGGPARSAGSTVAPSPPPPMLAQPKVPRGTLTASLTKGAMRGFTDELTKEAGLKEVLHRIFSGKSGAGRKMGFFEKRRAARALGIKPRDVEHTIKQRQRIGQVARGGALGGAAALGGLAGARISSQEHADE